MRIRPQLDKKYLFTSALIITLLATPALFIPFFIFIGLLFNPTFFNLANTGHIGIVILVALTLSILAILGITLIIMTLSKLNAERTEYTLKETGIEIKNAFIIPRNVFIPYTDITNILITQTPLQKRYKIATIRIQVKGYRLVNTDHGTQRVPIMYTLIGIPEESTFTQTLLTQWKEQNKGTYPSRRTHKTHK